MKKLILQKDFISDLFCLTKSGCSTTDDLADFLLKDFTGYHLICDFTSYQEYQSAALENPILESLLDKFLTITYSLDLENIVNDDSFYESLTNSRNIFLTKLDAKTCKELNRKRGCLFVSNQNISTTWSAFFNFRKKITLKVTKDKSIDQPNRFDSWSKMKDLSHPLQALIIFDKHLLDIPVENVNINIIPLIKNLLWETDHSRTSFVTIISETKHGFSLKRYVDKITEELIKDGLTNVKVNAIRHNKAFYAMITDFEGLHARLIITHYLHIISDAGFNYFKKNGSVENIANVSASLNLYSSNERSYMKDLNDIKAYLSKVTVNPKSFDLNYSDIYYPDQTNPLLN